MRRPSLRALFRILVVASLVVPLMGLGYEYAVTPGLTEDEKTLLLWAGHGGVLDILFPSDSGSDSSTMRWVWGGLLVLMLGILLTLQAGLFFFRAWARKWWTITSVFFLASSVGFGWTVMLPYTQFTYDLARFMEGVMLALMYASPLASAFTPSRLHGQDP